MFLRFPADKIFAKVRHLIMKIIFAGTPEFAAQALKAIAAAGFDIALVLTQPDRPAGRGLKMQASAVKIAAQALNLPIFQPETLKTPEAQAPLAAVNADLMIVAAYGLLLPQAVLDLPRLGCVNIHASLLPRWRGAAPIQRAILAGDAETGVTIMQMEAGLDTGAMLHKVATPILPSDTAASLHDRLASLGAQAMLDVLQDFSHFLPESQNDALAVYAAKISKAEAQINWQEDADLIARKIRAYCPVPVAFTEFAGKNCKIWSAQVVDFAAETTFPAGKIVCADQALIVACGRGFLQIDSLQLAGAKRVRAQDFVLGRAVLGQSFGAA